MRLDRTRAGQRIELVSTSDPWTRLHPGSQGTIVFEDDLGMLFVDWDDGSSLSLVPGEDRYRLI